MRRSHPLETERLIIREFVKKDYNSFYEFMKDEEATKYLLFTPDQKTNKGIRELLAFTIASYKEEIEMASLVLAEKERTNILDLWDLH